MITLALDMMGGDLGSAELLKGVERFKGEHPDVSLILVGKKEELESSKETILDAKVVLPMTAGALDALREKESSMYEAISLVKEGKAQGVVSVGSTGAFLSASTVILRKIPGVTRPALIAPFPTKIKGKQVVILDVGASNENSGEEVAQFAIMGDLYSRDVLGVKEPKVYLLANGTEEEKGSPEGKAAGKILKENKAINFCGNIEAREALSGEADVVATDGFSGNIFLKSSEGMAKMMSGMIKKAFKRNLLTKIGYVFSKKGFDEMSASLDYKNVGGAMLLGVNGVVVKGHGNCDARAFYHAIDVAYKLAKADVVTKLKEDFSHGE